LAEAREKREAARKLLLNGVNPSEHRKAAERGARLSEITTFEGVGREWLKRQEGVLARATYDKAAWMLETFVFPNIGNRALARERSRSERPLPQNCPNHQCLLRRWRLSFLFLFLQSLPSARLRQKQRNAMRVLSGDLLVLWDQVQTIATSETRGFDVDPYLFPPMKQRAIRLMDSLDKAIGVGPFGTIVTRREHALPLYTAFSASLLNAAGSDGEGEWLEPHLYMELSRLIRVCAEREKTRDRVLAHALDATRQKSLEHKAWTYLQQDAQQS
jgi:hypothetical protein